jgi:hypothetical protein
MMGAARVANEGAARHDGEVNSRGRLFHTRWEFRQRGGNFAQPPGLRP